jgi:hypothetical protein
MSCSHPRKVTTTCSKVTVIKDTFNLLMIQTSSQDSINTTMIQSVIDDKVESRMVTNMMAFFTRDIGMKMLGLEIKKDISIPRIRRISPYQGSDVLMRNIDSLGREYLGSVSSSTWGRSQMSSANTEDFLDLDLEN